MLPLKVCIVICQVICKCQELQSHHIIIYCCTLCNMQILLLLESFHFFDLKAHAKFWNPGRKLMAGEERKKKINYQKEWHT